MLVLPGTDTTHQTGEAAMREPVLTPRGAIVIGLIGGIAALLLRIGAAGQTLTLAAG